MTKHEIALQFGVSEKTVQRWVTRGCPYARRPDRALEFDTAAVARWLGTQGSDGDGTTENAGPDPGPAPTGGVGATKDSLNKAELMRRIATARKTELEVHAEKSLKTSGLAEKVRAARTLEDLGQLTQEVAAGVADGSLRPNRGNALRQILIERRLQLSKLLERDAQNPLAGRVLLCTAEVEDLIRAFEDLYSDERRARVLTFVAAELQADLKEFPPTDTSPTGPTTDGASPSTSPSASQDDERGP